MMTEPDKAKCFDALLTAARRLATIHDIESSTITVFATGVQLTMFRVMPDGQLGHVQYLMAWEEIALTKFDLLDSLVTDMREKLLAATAEGEPCTSPL